MTWYHGGCPGLEVGDELLPPSLTGVPTGSHEGRADRVFLTDLLAMAGAFAAIYSAPGGGWVYEAEPVGPTESDPDEPTQRGATMVQVERAVVSRVIGPVPALSRISFILSASLR